MTDPTRRSFLTAAAAATAASSLWASPLAAGTDAGPAAVCSPLRILVLGGTGFLGPHFVKAAVEKGHAVTLFHRGRTGVDLFPGLEHLKGDREKGDLAALEGREFDVVVDNSGYVPKHVEATAAMFAKTAKQYLFVSTVSVYRDPEEPGTVLDEGAPVATVTDEEMASVRTIRESLPHYGALKARCEQAAEAAMPGRVTVVRPGLIVGPRDTSDRFTWWPVRLDRGGEVLAPGNPEALVQFVDVRDLADWMLALCETPVFSVMNAVGFAAPVSMRDVLVGCKNATSTPATLTWVDESFLLERKVGPWMQMPLWIPESSRRVYGNSLARRSGLAFRPLADTIRDTLQWARTERGGQPFERTGLPAEREAALLQEWAKAKNG